MKKALTYVWAVVLVAAMVLTGCSSPAAAAAYTDSSQTIKMSPNQEFTIALQANPTTGYDWQQPVFGR